MYDDIGSQIKRPYQQRGCRIVDDQQGLITVAQIGDAFDVRQSQTRIAHTLHQYHLHPCRKSLFDMGKIIQTTECIADTKALECFIDQRIGTAEKAADTQHFVTALQQCGRHHGECSHA